MSLLLEQLLVILIFAYITVFLLFGLIKGRKYFKTYSTEKNIGDYLFHSINVTLTLAGLAVTAIAIFVGFGLNQLEELSSIILFFSLSFVMLTLSSNIARFPKRAYGFIADVLADAGVLAIGCGFLVFFEQKFSLTSALTLVYVFFIGCFLLLSFLDIRKYYKYWSLFNAKIKTQFATEKSILKDFVKDPKVVSDIERKLEKCNPVSFSKSLLKFKKPKNYHLRLIRRVWKKSKLTAIVCVFLMPLRMLPRRYIDEFAKVNRETFQRSNEELKKQLPKAKNKTQRLFIEAWIELNELGIEQTRLYLKETQIAEIGKKAKNDFLDKPTRDNLLKYWNSVKQSIDLGLKFSRLHKRKADVQDNVAKFDKRMTKLDKKDLEDFKRAIMVDILVSYLDERILFVNTPIELLLKSGKLSNRIRAFFLLTPVLRASAELVEGEQYRILEWFRTYQE